MFMSVVQLVLAPVIVGTTLNQYFPRVRDLGKKGDAWVVCFAQ
jgi:predicted Na+-dependent transporter